MAKQFGFINFSLLLIMAIMLSAIINWAYQEKQLEETIISYTGKVMKLDLPPVSILPTPILLERESLPRST